LNELFSCDHCNRIVYIEMLDHYGCTSCGHGQMKRLRPTTFCYQCQRPIYDNLDPSRDVLCVLCTQTSLVRKHIFRDLKKHRKDKGYSSRTMAALTGVSVTYYSHMENGRKPLNDKALAMMRESCR